ncbi:serine-rich adhesin for platelets isoform X3 [Periplaneta americana]|uniref:serine-rich adhesin for platelets isoform X3 n=1 Tax=Periplaneta americana TaxID=6978 RepID=UPI0037E8A36C
MMVPDSGGAPPGMDCMPLQRSPGPFHYLIHEQAKSLVALQELQNEVGALLEFRDLVMETFPHLRNKMVASGVAGITSSSNVSHTSSTPSSGTSNIPIPLTSSRREWEPGIRVRRKLQSHTSAKESEISVSSLASNRGRVSKTTAVHTQQPKSGEGINSGSGTSSAGSSAVQDSGFGTETSSSKEHCHSSSSSSTTTGPVVVHRPGSSTTAAATSSTVLDEAEDELWNLLDVIHRKGTKLREEVEHLQQRFQASDRLGMIGHKEGEGVLRRRSLGDIEQQLIQESGKFCTSEERERRLRILKTGRSRKALLGIEGGSLHDDFRKGHMMEKLDSNREARSEDEIRSLQRERDLLLDKVAEMEAETLASRARASQLQTELGCLIEAKRDLEEQLRAAVSQKSELNSRIHDLHMQFVGANKNGGSSSSYSPLSDATARKLLLVPGAKKPLVVNHASQERLRNVVSSQAAYGRGSSPGRGQSCFTPVPLTSRRFSEGATSIKTSDEKTITSSHLSSHSQDGITSLSRQESEDGVDRVKSESQSAEEESGRPRFKLGTLDGIVSSPSRIARTAHGVKPDPLKVAAILQEFSAIELQRHLLTTSVENKALHQRLERTVKSHVDLVEQLEKIKDENDDLKFQLEEKSIELEGTRARVRVLERLQQKTSKEPTTNLPPVLPPDVSTNPILPLLALPMPADDNTHHSSSTESAHDHTVGMSSDQGDAKKASQSQQMSPRRRPSKIPLPGTKSYCAPKPPSGKSASISNRSRGSPSLRSRTDSHSSLSGKNAPRESSWKNRSDSNSSLSGGGKSRESPCGGRNSSLSGRNNSRDSLNSGSKSRDSFTASTAKVRNGDSLSGKKSNGDSISSSVGKGRADTPSHQSSFSSNVSGNNRRESLSSGKAKDSSSFSSSAGRKGLHHQTSVSTRVGRGGSNNSSINHRIGNSNFSEQGEQNSKESGTSITDVHISLDDTTEQQGDTYPDSLNHLSSQESSPTAFKLSTNIVTSNNSVSSEQQNSVYQTSETQAFPWHSSSSEYFDSINNSGSAVFQNSSILRSFSFYQDQYLQSSAQGEALAECDSLEKEAVGVELNNIIADSGNDDSNFVVSSTSSRKLWVKTDNPSEW